MRAAHGFAAHKREKQPAYSLGTNIEPANSRNNERKKAAQRAVVRIQSKRNGAHMQEKTNYNEKFVKKSIFYANVDTYPSI